MHNTIEEFLVTTGSKRFHGFFTIVVDMTPDDVHFRGDANCMIHIEGKKVQCEVISNCLETFFKRKKSLIVFTFGLITTIFMKLKINE